MYTPSSLEQKTPKLKPFKLCHINKREPGRSHIQVGKALKADPITPKFYSNVKVECSNTNLDKKIQELIVKGPLEKYKEPKTENQCYGWYINMYKPDYSIERILNFRISPKPFIKEHLMSYEKIRE